MKTDPAVGNTPVSEKLHKVLAARGLGSRREMERWILAGRITVNGKAATLGDRVADSDRIAVDGRRLTAGGAPRPRVLVLNKREGVICSRRDPEGRKTVFDGLPSIHRGRWITVGRLDINTSGLLMVTNDGELAHKLMHPSTGIDREYAVRIDGELTEAALEQVKAGVDIDGEIQRFSDIRYYDGSGSNHWYHAVLMEGRNREVRRLFERLGRKVTRLKRVRYGPVVLPSWLRRGRVAELGPADLTALYGLLRLPCDAPPRKGRPGARQETRSLLIPYPELPASRQQTSAQVHP